MVLEWAYSPADYFEEPISLKREKYDMTINNGKVEARIKPELYNIEPDMRNELHNMLNNRFLGVQLLTHKNYELSKASMYRLHADGRKDITLFVESCVCNMLMGSVDLIQTDSHGNIVKDTRRERIDKKNHLSDLTEKYCIKDPLVKYLLNTYSMSVKDPDNEFFYLYDIRDALKSHFHGEPKACEKLGISKTRFNRLRQLTNNSEIKQGRHRGLSDKFKSLRNATDQELQEARNIARQLVESYFNYLEKNP